MSAHSIAPGRRHVRRPRPPWASEYRHLRRSYLVWRACSAVEAAGAVVMVLALVAALVVVPVLLATGGAR